jgi:hypothetical protein
VHVHYVFDSQTRKYRYKLSICHHTHQDDSSQRVKSSDSTNQSSYLFTGHFRCTSSSTRKALTHHDLPVHLLRVCRQIYHEAALKPFSEPTFILVELKEICMRALFEALVPTQIRAIKHLHFASRGSECPPHSVMRRLSGVEYFNLEVVAWINDHWCIPEINDHLYWLGALTPKLNHTFVSKLDLKKISVTMTINERTVSCYTEAEEQVLVGFVDRAEEVLRQSATQTSTTG